MSTGTIEAPPAQEDTEVHAKRWAAGDRSDALKARWSLAAARAGEWPLALDLLQRIDPWSNHRAGTRRQLLALAPPDFVIPEVPQSLGVDREKRVERMLREMGESLIPGAVLAGAATLVSFIPLLGQVLATFMVVVAIPSLYVFGKANLSQAWSDPDGPPEMIPAWPGLGFRVTELAVIGGALTVVAPLAAMALGNPIAGFLTPVTCLLATLCLISSYALPGRSLEVLRRRRARILMLEGAVLGGFAATFVFLVTSMLFTPVWGAIIGATPAWFLAARTAGWAIHIDDVEGQVDDLEAYEPGQTPDVPV